MKLPNLPTGISLMDFFAKNPGVDFLPLTPEPIFYDIEDILKRIKDLEDEMSKIKESK